MFVGAASAVGMAIEVPILTRSLADSLTWVAEDGLPLPYKSSLLACLDAGIDKNSPYALEESYLMDWWNSNADAEIMTEQSARSALKYHKQLRAKRIPDEAKPIKPTSPSVNIPLSSCPNCKQYQNIATELVGNLKSISEFSKTVELSTESRLVLSQRRASGLYSLHEKVLEKELQSTPAVPGKASNSASASKDFPTEINNIKINRESQRLAKSSGAELKRLMQLPATSHKWVWGPELTLAEVNSLGTTPTSLVVPHSGYDTSLKTGPLGRNKFYSDIPPIPTGNTSAVYSSVGLQDAIPNALAEAEDHANAEAEDHAHAEA